MKDDPIVRFASRDAFRAWLEENHERSQGAWLQIAKKGAGEPSVTYAEAVELALCFGWIDGQRRARDERWFEQRFTPRRARSIWSKINCAKVEQLIASGEMRPAGLREVERAKADGRWERAYDSPKNAGVHPELAAALAKSPRASELYAKLDSQNRFAISHRIQTAKKDETRARRIAQFVAMLERGEKIHER